jgi:hypothetical protein
VPGLLDEGLETDPRAAVLGWVGPNAIDPRWRGAPSYELPKQPPPGTYTGDIPTPPSDYGSTLLNLPHDYQRQLELLRPSDPKAYRELLKLIYMNRDNRRA